MKIIIQSFSDIITNSSSEVFVSTKNNELLRVLDEWGIDYNCYETEEDLRNSVENNPWEFDEITTHNPYNDYCMIEELWNIKGKDNVWNFFKNLYVGLLGKVIIDVDRDYLYRKEQEHNELLTKYIKR